MVCQDLVQCGVLNVKDVLILVEMFVEQVECCVKLGFVLVEFVKVNGFEVKLEQICVEVDEFVKSYEDLKEVVCWYYFNQQCFVEMEVFVVESNVVDFVLGKVKVMDKEVSFEVFVSVLV